MLNSIIKKLLAGSISLGIISLLIFFLSKAVPGDPVVAAMGIDSESETKMNFEVEYERKKKALGLDLPYFYFSMLPSNFPKNLNESGTLSQVNHRRTQLLSSSKILTPKFFWHGTSNQYHSWLFGKKRSLVDGKPVRNKISRSLVWTVFMIFISILLSYLLGILIGIGLTAIKSNRLKSWVEALLFGVYAIPIFWMATLLLVFFTTKEYGSWTNIFPSVGLAPIDFGEAWYVRVSKYGAQLILPCFILVVHNLAFLSMLTKRNIEKNKSLGFVMTSKAYGFSERETLFKEVLPISLLPLITSVSSSIPAAVSGSLIVEIIFNIPGMGRLLYNSILNYDWPVVFPIVMLVAVITFVSFLVADIFYKIADPRIR